MLRGKYYDVSVARRFYVAPTVTESDALSWLLGTPVYWCHTQRYMLLSIVHVHAYEHVYVCLTYSTYVYVPISHILMYWYSSCNLHVRYLTHRNRLSHIYH